MSIIMNIMTQMFFYRKKMFFILYIYNEDTLKGHHSTWHSAYDMHEKQISSVQK
jgi:hypothetical protein